MSELGAGGLYPQFLQKFLNHPFLPQILAVLCLQPPHFSVSPCTFKFTPTSLNSDKIFTCFLNLILLQIITGNDPLDRKDFNPVNYINTLFPTEQVSLIICILNDSYHFLLICNLSRTDKSIEFNWCSHYENFW